MFFGLWLQSICKFILIVEELHNNSDYSQDSDVRHTNIGQESTLTPLTVHNVYFVKYDVTVSFLAQVLDTVTYFVSHVLDSGYSDIFWHIL